MLIFVTNTLKHCGFPSYRILIFVFLYDCFIPMSRQQVHISKEYLQLEPIGLVFVFFFALILVIQFTAMLFHRFGTLAHILSSTELNFFKKKSEDISQDALIDKVSLTTA